MAHSITRQLIVAEARRRNWRVEYIGEGDHFYKIIHPDGRWELLRGSRPMRTAANGAFMARNKSSPWSLSNRLATPCRHLRLLRTWLMLKRF